MKDKKITLAKKLAERGSQTALAQQVGCRPQMISRIISGARNPSARLAYKIADALGYECRVNRSGRFEFYT